MCRRECLGASLARRQRNQSVFGILAFAELNAGLLTGQPTGSGPVSALGHVGKHNGGELHAVSRSLSGSSNSRCLIDDALPILNRLVD
jgi:hypothetical protein